MIGYSYTHIVICHSDFSLLLIMFSFSRAPNYKRKFITEIQIYIFYNLIDLE